MLPPLPQRGPRDPRDPLAGSGARAVPQAGSRGTDRDVDWRARPAPGGDAKLWEAVVACHEALVASGRSVTWLARQLTALGEPLRRETLSRILNGRQRTTWDTVERLALALRIELPAVAPLPPDHPDR